MSYQVLARKWRPRTFSEMVGQEHVLRALTNALDSGRLHHAFLFTGTRGVGKTTLARILAKSLNCESGMGSTPCGQCQTCVEIDEGRYVDLIEVDAASRTKVEDTRDLLDNVQYAPSRGRYKVYLVDEVHMLSNHSFNALLKTLEEPPPHVKFLLATTDPQKLPVTILSRCLQFNLKRLHVDLIVGHLQQLLNNEQVDFEVAALKHLARAADGSMRDALSLLDQAIAFGAGKVLDDDVKQMLGTIEHTHIYEILMALSARDSAAVVARLHKLNQKAPDYTNVLAELLTVLHYIALLQQVPDAYDDAMGDKDRLSELSSALTPEDIQLFYQIGVNGRRDLPYAPDLFTGLEMILLRMLAFRPVTVTTGNIPTSEFSQSVLTSQEKTQNIKPETAKSDISAQQPKAQPKAQEPVVQSPRVNEQQKPFTSNDWRVIVDSLTLGGVLNQMAMNCAIKEHTDTKIILSLEPGCENLLTGDRQSRLQESLQQYFQKPTQLEIMVEQPANETPAQQQQRENNERLAAAQNSIQSDTNVQKIIDTFGAQINSDSIQPVD